MTRLYGHSSRPRASMGPTARRECRHERIILTASSFVGKSNSLLTSRNKSGDFPKGPRQDGDLGFFRGWVCFLAASCRSGADYKEQGKAMCIFIAGIQPKTVNVDGHSRMCASCGLYQARLKRIDHYLSLFFIPLLRVKKGDPFIRCESCGSVFGESGETGYETPRRPENRCPRCGAALDSSFRFCPQCGKQVEVR
jgi:hypothetical protein